MGRPPACVACRQNKLRCNASFTFPAPCSRCAGRNVTCRVDSNYKRVPTKNRVEQLTQELDRLKSGIRAPREGKVWPCPPGSSQSNTSASVDTSLAADAISGLTGAPLLKSPTSEHDSSFRLGDLVLLNPDVDALFQEYFLHYHEQLPVLDEQAEPASIIGASPLLFWTIIFTACRNLPSQQHCYLILCNKLPGLLGNLMIAHHKSVHAMQALLILSMWPPPVQRQSDDMRWTYSGLAMQMALQLGYHRVGYEHEYHAVTYSRSLSDQRRHTLIWRCWCFINALLSCELGLPCLIPFDALEIKPSEESALPVVFLSKLRIVLFVSRINDTLGNNTSKDGRSRMRMIRLLEKDLNSTVSGLRQSPAQWDATVEFIYPIVLLNLYSFGLRWSSTMCYSDPDYTIIQGSAAQIACQLIELHANSSRPVDSPPSSPQLRSQRYGAKFHIQFNTIALLMLLKISAMNQISLQQLGEVDDAIRLGHRTLMACSYSEGDESHRAGAVVEILCKKGVINSVRHDSPVESRFGASVWLELVAAAVRWRRQNSKADTRPGGSNPGDNDDSNDSHRDSTLPSSTTSRTIGPGDPATAAMMPANNEESARLAQADFQEIAYPFPFSIEDWSMYLDVAQADLGLDYDSSWWGGVERMES